MSTVPSYPSYPPSSPSDFALILFAEDLELMSDRDLFGDPAHSATWGRFLRVVASCALVLGLGVAAGLVLLDPCETEQPIAFGRKDAALKATPSQGRSPEHSVAQTTSPPPAQAAWLSLIARTPVLASTAVFWNTEHHNSAFARQIENVLAARLRLLWAESRPLDPPVR